MRMKRLLATGLGALGLGLAAVSAEAAPVMGLTAAVDRDATVAAVAQPVTWYGRRHCHWHYGHSHCGWGRYHRKWRGYGAYGWGYPYRYHHHGYGYRRWY